VRQFEPTRQSRFWLVQTARADTETSAEAGADTSIWHLDVEVTWY
jgi:hypothetical protein